jgi:beta-ribofuranosylaminobenzene 5'-phosphate synthase
MTVRVESGARLHLGFRNLSLARDRLYGSLGVALDEPTAAVSAEPASTVECSHGAVEKYAERAVELLGVAGADVTVESSIPRHVGLGSGTQLALCTLTAVARAHDRDPAVREHAPALERGGRSGVGVAAFEAGGFVLDRGHPVERFADGPPDPGAWTVPEVVERRPVPSNWRFVLAIPDADAGRNGDREQASMRRVVRRADPDVADRIERVVEREVLPALATRDAERFGAAVAEVGRLNGRWYADVQGGVYRQPVAAVVDELADADAVYGTGQSSWGPAVYAVTTAARADAAREAAERAIEAAGTGGTVSVVAPRNNGRITSKNILLKSY